MKKIIFTLIAMMCVSSMVAQTERQGRNGRMDPKEMVAKRTEDMTKKYGLSSEQAEKVKALNEKYMGQRGPRPNGNRPAPSQNDAQNRPEGRPNRQGGPGRMRPDMEQYNKELQQIMNESQYKAYTADMEKMRAERQARFGGNR